MQDRGALVVSELSALDADAASRGASARRTGPGWIYLYIAIQFGCQLALLTEALAPARVLFRSMALGASLFMLVAIPGRPAFRHPSRYFALAVLTIISLAAFNPESSTLLAAAAHLAFYVAVIAPVFWTMRLQLTETVLVHLITILWAFGTLSSAVGILQIY